MAANLIPIVNEKLNEQEALGQLDLEFGEQRSAGVDHMPIFSPFIVYVDESGTANFDKPGSSSDFPV